jgi:hypothetical protein
MKPADDQILRRIGKSLRDCHIRCTSGTRHLLPGQIKERGTQQSQNQGEDNDTKKRNTLLMSWTFSICLHGT